jgi:hypothetical protein
MLPPVPVFQLKQKNRLEEAGFAKGLIVSFGNPAVLK